jgi:hypothetical protein
MALTSQQIVSASRLHNGGLKDLAANTTDSIKDAQMRSGSPTNLNGEAALKSVEEG